MSGLTGAGDRVEPPDQLASPGGVCGHAAADSKLASGNPCDDEPVVAKGRTGDRCTLSPVADGRRPDLLARTRVKCNERPVELAKVDATITDRDTTTRPTAAHGVDALVQVARVLPERLSRLYVEGEHVTGARRHVRDAVVDERLRLARILEGRRRVQMNAPNPLEAGDVRTIDLVERRVTLIEDCPAVGDPILLRERRKLISCESRDVLAAATAAGKCQSTRDDEHYKAGDGALMPPAHTTSRPGLQSRSHSELLRGRKTHDACSSRRLAWARFVRHGVVVPSRARGGSI
jgi:hypothetical protein